MSDSKGGSDIGALVTTLTSNGRGAIAVLALWGPDALRVANAAFRPRRPPGLSGTRLDRPRLGRVGEGAGDEVVAIVSDSLRGLTVEFQCHGGAAASELVLEGLVNAGALRSDPVGWLRNRDGSPLRTAALLDLARASTARTAEVLLDQVNGALDREIETLIDLIREAPRGCPGEPMRRLNALLGRAELGGRLLRGWRVALAGRPNAGKSSLLNALAGFARSIVDATPGTTRDVISVPLALEGWPIELADTAGLRPSPDALEGMGIDRARLAHERADLVLPVLDRSRSLQAEDLEFIRHGVQNRAPIVANKSDRTPMWNLSELEGVGTRIIPVSALELTGLDELVEAVANRLVPDPPPPAAGVPFRAAHARLLQEAGHALSSGDRDGAVDRLSELLTGPDDGSSENAIGSPIER